MENGRAPPHGAGDWSFPGWHLEWGEGLEECAVREVREETGLEIAKVRPAAFTNDIFQEEGRHYVTLFMICEWKSGEAEVKEPEKCEKWGWFEWESLPQPRFLPLRNLIESGWRP